MAMSPKKIDHTQLICDISELSGLLTETTTLESCLQRIVEMIAHHMGSEVCSIYLYHEGKQELILRATTGLNLEFVGKVTLKVGEGLTGLAFKEQKPICERHASKNKNFKYFPGLGEERFESFLVVPIIRGTKKIGALVIQNAEKDFFGDQDIVALRAISSQLANTIEMTQLILSLEEKDLKENSPIADRKLKYIKGKVGSGGVAYGEAVVLPEYKNLRGLLESKRTILYTNDDFHASVEKSQKELEVLERDIQEKISDVTSLIFGAQRLMLKDRAFIDAIAEQIKQGVHPPLAIVTVVEDYQSRLGKLKDDYLKEKGEDVCDVGRRLLENLSDKDDDLVVLEGSIAIAWDLLPSDVLKLATQKIKGVILLRGGVTGHVAILAQSLHLPLIISDHEDLLSIPFGTKILIDGDQGNVYINPSAQILEPFKKKEKYTKDIVHLKKDMASVTQTADGARVILQANINLLSDIKDAQDFKAEGVGLYRTEFPFIVRNQFPSEEEQYVIYKKLVDGMKGKEVTFRTLDIGGDKILSYFDYHLKEKNPYMGMRSIRFSLKHLDIFSAQIRAILRAGCGAPIRIMFPMISSLDELLAAKAVFENCCKSLKKEKIDHQADPRIGMMIELPSVMEIIEDLAQQVHFFSIGTNDFIQYMLAVDRSNEKVADLYLPQHPSVLRAIKRVVETALKFDIDISICGNMAYDEKYINYFLGIGVRKFSVNPTFLPKIHSIIKAIKIPEAKKIADLMLKKNLLKDVNDVMALLDR